MSFLHRLYFFVSNKTNWSSSKKKKKKQIVLFTFFIVFAKHMNMWMGTYWITRIRVPALSVCSGCICTRCFISLAVLFTKVKSCFVRSIQIRVLILNLQYYNCNWKRLFNFSTRPIIYLGRVGGVWSFVRTEREVSICLNKDFYRSTELHL